MKYIAIFDIPDDYGIGCAIAKIASKGKENYSDDDFENAYAQIEPLAEEKAEIFERYDTVESMIHDLDLKCIDDMPSFWRNNGKDYTVIETKYYKGYRQALKDVEKEIRLRFGFAERDSERDSVMSMPFDLFFKPPDPTGRGCINWSHWTPKTETICRDENNKPKHLVDKDAVLELVMQYVPDDDGTCSKAHADLRDLLDEIENIPEEGMTDKCLS